jgi:hypothetical protein
MFGRNSRLVAAVAAVAALTFAAAAPIARAKKSTNSVKITAPAKIKASSKSKFTLTVSGNSTKKNALHVYYQKDVKCAKVSANEPSTAKLLITKQVGPGKYSATKKGLFETTPQKGYFCAYLELTGKHASKSIEFTKK